jgi:tetratricopeptide (TPR) repeat protein
MAWQIAVQVVLSALILLAGLWLWELAMSPLDHRRLLGDRAELIRVLNLPNSRTILDEPINLQGGSGESLPFAPLIAALAAARRKACWKTCGLSLLLAAAILAVSCLFSFVYLGINVGLLLLSSVLSLLGSRDDGESVLPFARVLLKWHDVNPNGCEKFCNEERPDFKNLHEVLLGLSWDPIPPPAPRSEAAPPPAKPGAEAFYARADVYLQARDFQKAVADCTQAIRLRPEHAEAHCRRGNAYLEAGEINKAMADFIEAIRLKPDYAEAFYLRACTYLKIGKSNTAYGELQSAISDCSTAIRLNPKYLEAYCRRGDVYLQINEVHKALADFSQAMRLNPEFAEPYYRRGLDIREKRAR